MGGRPDFSQIFCYWKILEQTRAGLWAPRCYNGHSHTLLDCLRLEAIVWHAVCSRQRRSSRGPLPGQAVGTPQIFPQILCASCVTLEHLFWKRQNPEEKICRKSAEKSAHCAAIICAQKSVQTISAKICAQISAPNQRPKTYSVSLEVESQKETQKTSAPNLCKTPAPTYLSLTHTRSVYARTHSHTLARTLARTHARMACKHPHTHARMRTNKQAMKQSNKQTNKKHTHILYWISEENQRKTKGQQLKGKIVSEFSHFFTLFGTFS